MRQRDLERETKTSDIDRQFTDCHRHTYKKTNRQTCGHLDIKQTERYTYRHSVPPTQTDKQTEGLGVTQESDRQRDRRTSTTIARQTENHSSRWASMRRKKQTGWLADNRKNTPKPNRFQRNTETVY